jgi:hypothetical protein
MKFRIIFVFGFFAMGCQSEDKPSENPTRTPVETKSTEDDLNSRAKRHVEAQLQIPVTEQYGLKIFKAHLDSDGKEDAIIAVNRLEHALEGAAKNPNSAKMAEIGFVGNHNLLFFYDGGLDQISPAIAVPSSPYVPLEIQFAPITAPNYQDIMVTYRIRNSGYRAFFTVLNHTPTRFFEWPEFDEIGTPRAKGFAFQFTESSLQPRRNIQIYAAKIELEDTVKNFFVARPKLLRTPTLLHEFFYLPAKQTYVTKK